MTLNGGGVGASASSFLAPAKTILESGKQLAAARGSTALGKRIEAYRRPFSACVY
jgi:hypothetical protein